MTNSDDPERVPAVPDSDPVHEPLRGAHLKAVAANQDIWASLRELHRSAEQSSSLAGMHRAADAAGELESLLRRSAQAYMRQVVLPTEEHEDEAFREQGAVSAEDRPSPARRRPSLQIGPEHDRDDRGILRTGIQASLVAMVASTFLLLASNAAGLAGLSFAFSMFCLANFAAFRVRESNVILSPRVALMGMYSGIGLALTVIVAALS
jgi:hypothetical protein